MRFSRIGCYFVLCGWCNARLVRPWLNRTTNIHHPGATATGGCYSTSSVSIPETSLGVNPTIATFLPTKEPPPPTSTRCPNAPAIVTATSSTLSEQATGFVMITSVAGAVFGIGSLIFLIKHSQEQIRLDSDEDRSEDAHTRRQNHPTPEACVRRSSDGYGASATVHTTDSIVDWFQGCQSVAGSQRRDVEFGTVQDIHSNYGEVDCGDAAEDAPFTTSHSDGRETFEADSEWDNIAPVLPEISITESLWDDVGEWVSHM